MVERAITIEIKQESTLQLAFKIFLMLNRILYPFMILMLIISGLLFYTIHISLFYLLYIVLLVQTIFISISWHECIHISFAKFLSYEASFISFIPCSISTRTHFKRTRKIEDIDKTGILLSAPLILTVLGVIGIWIFNKWVHNMAVNIFIIAFLLVNVLSLLPFRKYDGGRAYQILKNLGLRAIKLCIMSIFIYCLYAIGFKHIIPPKNSQKIQVNKEKEKRYDK